MTLTKRERLIYHLTTWMTKKLDGFEGSVCPRCHKGKIVKDPWLKIYKDELFCSRCNLQITNLKDLLIVIRNKCPNLPDKDIVELLQELVEEREIHSSMKKQFNNLQHIMHKPKKYRDVCSRTALPGQVKKGGTTKRIPNYKKHEFHEDVQEYWK